MKKRLGLGLVLSLAMLIFVSPVYAIPALPHAFYGDVEINSVSAPDGSLVSAVVSGGNIVAVQNPVSTSGGSYGISSLKLLVQGDISNGAMIHFYVNGIDTGNTATYEHGGGATRVDLSVTIPIPVVPQGGGGGESTYLVRASFFGEAVVMKVSKSGKLQEGVEMTSGDGALTFVIHGGTYILDKDGNPQSRLTVEVNDNPPSPPEDANIIGLVYDFSPDGTTFSPPAEMVWEYNPNELAEGVAEEDLIIAFYDGNKWITLDGIVDTESNTITVFVHHFTEFAVISLKPIPMPAPVLPKPVPPAPVPSTPTPPSPPSPVPTPPAQPINWYIIGGALAGVIIIGALVRLIVRRRSA